MTQPMMDVFRLEIAYIQLSLDSNLSSGEPARGLRYYPEVNEFVELRATVVNLMREFSSTCYYYLPTLN